MRVRRLAAEEAADAESRAFEEREVENLRRESEAFLARQMDEMQALAEEQRKAGMLFDDGVPVKLNVSLASALGKEDKDKEKEKKVMLAMGEEEEDGIVKRKVPLAKLDFSVADAETTKEKLESIRQTVPKDKETLFKSRVRWDGMSDVSCRSIL
jgi:RNA-binding protein 25